MTTVGLFAYFWQQQWKVKQAIASQTGHTGTPQIGGPFRLLNARTLRPFVSIVDGKDKLMLVYFGFTHCPDVCPEELEKLSKALALLTPEERASILPLFITIDPERDTAENMREYIKGMCNSWGTNR